MRLHALAVLVLVGVSCTFSLGSLAPFPCAADRTCPPNYVCNAQHLCAEAVVGCWSWFTGGVVHVLSDGTLTHDSNNDTGTWTDDGKNNYSFSWSSGHLDSLTLSSSGNSLSGTNDSGTAVTGTRVACPDGGM
jgi:hypothetical protein